jgi:hypothetical protein
MTVCKPAAKLQVPVPRWRFAVTLKSRVDLQQLTGVEMVYLQTLVNTATL